MNKAVSKLALAASVALALAFTLSCSDDKDDSGGGGSGGGACSTLVDAGPVGMVGNCIEATTFYYNAELCAQALAEFVDSCPKDFAKKCKGECKDYQEKKHTCWFYFYGLGLDVLPCETLMK